MIAHNKPTLGKQEQQAVFKVLDSGYIAQGLEVERFENEFCDFLGVRLSLYIEFIHLYKVAIVGCY